MKTSFRVDIFDRDGDINESGLFIYFGDSVILKFQDVLELEETIDNLKRCAIEAREQMGD